MCVCVCVLRGVFDVCVCERVCARVGVRVCVMCMVDVFVFVSMYMFIPPLPPHNENTTARS